MGTVSFWSEENVLKSTVVMIAQPLDIRETIEVYTLNGNIS